MDKLLKLKVYVDGGANDTPFPNSDNPIVIGAFRYDAKRMGGAPTITATVMYPICLDDVWTDSVYAKFNGEKYYLKQTPTSSYDNEDSRYKHSIELVSERSILDDVYFFDVVTDNPQGEDKPVSNSLKVTFFGNVYEFVKRLNASLKYSKVNYTVVVDESDEIPTEDKLVSFEDQFFSNVLQEIYNTYEVPYYFDGRTIHIGYSKGDVVIPDLEYGIDNALLSITKTNANHKIVNRVTGVGSSDNIPFYYPNNSPKGEIEAIESDGSQLGVEIIDSEAFSNKIELNGVITYTAQGATVTRVTDTMGNSVSSGANSITTRFTYKGFSTKYEMRITSYANGSIPLTISPILNFYKYKDSDDTVGERATGKTQIKIFRKGELLAKSDDFVLSKTFDIELPQGSSVLSVHVIFNPEYDSSTNWFDGSVGLSWATDSKEGWYYKDKEVELKDLGLSISNTAPQSGSTITQKLVKYINTSPNLMPSVYRTTDGKERFYNAIDKIYDGWEFNNPYVEGKPKEHIIKVDDIKPTIKEAINSSGLRMDMFSEFAYDDDDNDETLPEEDSSDRKFLHSYFFGKLRKLDFNLFDHAIEQQPMTVSFTSGDCGACNFEIGVSDEFPNKNPVLVNADGTLKRDSNGRVICGQFQKIKESELQDRQQDTINNEVWIALKKEDTTYGILMPKAPKFNENGEQIEAGHRPKAAKDEDGTPNNDGDTFVILGIHLPKSYIINAEKKLEDEIIKYLKENNDEKFTFSINFSRIYFAENQDILSSLNENSKVRVIYDNIPYDLYVSSFSYSISEGDILPDIKVELDDTLKVSSNAIRNAINDVKSELGKAINNVDVVGIGTPYFLRKDGNDEARGQINFRKGLTFGNGGNGGKIDMLDGNSAKLTIDYIEVKKKATFTSLEIQEKTHVGGQMLVTPAAINCNGIEELDGCYRCYFQTEGEGGSEIFNQFVVGDQAICQTFNVWESKYYWRLVTGIGENYIDLSKEDCDEGSDIPSVGDKIIQLGHRSDETRQNAIVIAAYGDGSPYIIQYKGINSFEIGDDKIVTKLSSTENIFTGKVHMEFGSDGLNQLPEWIEVKDKAEEALEKAGSISEEAFAELEQYIDDVRQELQEQIDGAVDSYFEDYEPSTSNYPAKDWTSEEKESHLNDTFTNLADGRSWRWSKAAGVYTWVEIADTATSEALKIAGQAKESADRKIRMFVEQPYTPYSIGDLWSRGEEAPLMRCIKDKESGSFSEEDWDLADNSQSYTDEVVSNIKIGGANLLRNSGFTGDYLSEQLADEKVLDAASELYSAPLDHWSSTATTVIDSDDTISGKAVSLTSGTLSQELYYNTVVGAEYVLSFKAKGEGILSFTVGDANGSVSLTPEMTSYEVVVTPTTSSDIFRISNATCTLGNLKLEKGNKATAWNASPLDNASDRAYYQSLKYLQNAFEGATEINGGLVLTEQIKVGDYDKETKKWVKESGGMSGTYEDDTDVAFWAGGNLEKAITAVSKYDNDPTYQPTEEELATMAKFVVTHGGKAILNEAVVKGTIYASDGEFTGKVNAKEGTFKGNVSAQYGNVGCMDIGDDNVSVDYKTSSLRNHSSIRSNYGIAFHSKDKSDNTEVNCSFGYKSVQSSSYTYDLNGNLLSDSPLIQYRPGLCVEVDSKRTTPYDYLNAIYVSMTGAKENNAIRVANGDIRLDNGRVCGLRPNSRVVTSNNNVTLTEYDHTIVFNVASGTVHVYLPSSPKDGQEYDIYTCHDTMDITIHTQGGINMYDFINANDHTEASYTANKRRHIHIFYAGGQWWENYRYLQS